MLVISGVAAQRLRNDPIQTGETFQHIVEHHVRRRSSGVSTTSRCAQMVYFLRSVDATARSCARRRRQRAGRWRPRARDSPRLRLPIALQKRARDQVQVFAHLQKTRLLALHPLRHVLVEVDPAAFLDGIEDQPIGDVGRDRDQTLTAPAISRSVRRVSELAGRKDIAGIVAGFGGSKMAKCGSYTKVEGRNAVSSAAADDEEEITIDDFTKGGFDVRSFELVAFASGTSLLSAEYLPRLACTKPGRSRIAGATSPRCTCEIHPW